ncbi:hypothetical protein EDC01DRAFT_631191 [Geopyxis carbonaria]|nr:hypothetical protein EDC01DRAFT_631191 [Geopyxis carbonaria]
MLSNSANMVYISGDRGLDCRSPFEVDESYTLYKTLTVMPTPEWGVQLRRDGKKCGWVKKEYLDDILEHLDQEKSLKCHVTYRSEPWKWGKSWPCFWGQMQWMIITKPE